MWNSIPKKKGNKQKYCSRKCAKIKTRKNYKKGEDPFFDNLSPGTIGAISELKISADLLSKGFEVFRAVSPSCSCDLAILRNGRLLRIEVTTGKINQTGKVMHTTKDNRKFEHLAIVTKCGKIIYDPELPII